MRFVLLSFILLPIYSALGSELHWHQKYYSCTEQETQSDRRFDIHVESDNDSLSIGVYEADKLVQSLKTYAAADGIHLSDNDFISTGFSTIEGEEKVKISAFQLDKAQNTTVRTGRFEIDTIENTRSIIEVNCQLHPSIYWGNSMVLLNNVELKIALSVQLYRRCPNVFKNSEVEIEQEVEVTETEKGFRYSLLLGSYQSNGSSRRFEVEVEQRDKRRKWFYMTKADCN